MSCYRRSGAGILFLVVWVRGFWECSKWPWQTASGIDSFARDRVAGQG